MDKTEKDIVIEVVGCLKRISHLSSSNVALLSDMDRNTKKVLENTISSDRLYKEIVKLLFKLIKCNKKK